MLITLAVILCQINGLACVEKVVTDSDNDPTLNMMTCGLAQPGIADWIAHQPQYKDWRVSRIRCVPGVYVNSRAI